jgi:hypothetical protein
MDSRRLCHFTKVLLTRKAPHKTLSIALNSNLQTYIATSLWGSSKFWEIVTRSSPGWLFFKFWQVHQFKHPCFFRYSNIRTELFKEGNVTKRSFCRKIARLWGMTCDVIRTSKKKFGQNCMHLNAVHSDEGNRESQWNGQLCVLMNIQEFQKDKWMTALMMKKKDSYSCTLLSTKT